MHKLVKVLTVLSCILALSPAAYATNGDNLIAIGPIANAMGGVGIAAPQDAISAVFANPAAMCFGPYCPSSEFNFAGSAFMPHIDAKVTANGQTFSAQSDEKVYAIPAIGISVPITAGAPFWRFGLAAYGVSGLGVDYRNSGLDQPNFFNFGAGATAPLAAGIFTQLQIMKFAPAISVQPLPGLSFGAAMHVDYATLDLQRGSSSNYGLGVQLGTIYKFNDNLSFGLDYVSPQNVDHRKVVDFEGDGHLDTLKLEAPQQVGIGAAYTFPGINLLVETDVKWINWADANGYQSFDWEDQWVYALGAQYKPIPKLALRAGYNFGNSPVKEHNGWNGAAPHTIQGHVLPTYFFETFRVIGFPAVVEHHLTCGVGYEFTPRLALNAGYMHAFANTITESGTDFFGNQAGLESTLSQDSLDFGVTWRF